MGSLDLHGTTVAEATVIVQEVLAAQPATQGTTPMCFLHPFNGLMNAHHLSTPLEDHHWTRIAFREPDERVEARAQEAIGAGRVGCWNLGCRFGRSRSTLIGLVETRGLELHES